MIFFIFYIFIRYSIYFDFLTCYDLISLAIKAQVANPSAVAVYNGYTFITDTDSDAIRMTDLRGYIYLVCGTGYKDIHTDDLVLQARLNSPVGMVIDANGMMYFADSQNNVIRKIDTSKGAFDAAAGRAKWTVSTIIGTGYPGETIINEDYFYDKRLCSLGIETFMYSTYI